MKLMILIMGLAFATPNQNKLDSNNQLENVQQQKAQVCKRVKKEEFKAKMNSLKNYQLIDIRTAGEFKRGTIEGAKNIDFYSSNFTTQISQLDKSEPVLIFCQSGGRSAQALQKFKSLGFSYVLELEGGYGNWVR
ncbi:rhodanese-like domain-containing protein [Paracrocinitomix mangrovi]|uniref:rhodanese-like domain-containing protein n=1 Tax=Paracrocinitomix mangrovi TaxID=2862509 RepID=UPI001C8E84D8|nr:rhodanese-like domain-containing protein [Paracrocinitomix mangrovi]UKN01071.1 rhodanese-like domain-containing protein [Paracrocinitomix mangrovi]